MARSGLNVSTTVPVGADLVSDALYEQIIKADIGAAGEIDMLTAGQKTKAHSVPVTIASDQDALTVDGTVAVSSLPELPAGDNVIGAALDGGAGWNASMGVSNAAVLSANATGGVDVTDAPAAGQKLVITDIVVSSDTAMAITFEEETSGRDVFKVFIPANGLAQITPRSKCKLATADKKLRAVASVAGNIAVTVFHYSEA